MKDGKNKHTKKDSHSPRRQVAILCLLTFLASLALATIVTIVFSSSYQYGDPVAKNQMDTFVFAVAFVIGISVVVTAALFYKWLHLPNKKGLAVAIVSYLILYSACLAASIALAMVAFNFANDYQFSRLPEYWQIMDADFYYRGGIFRKSATVAIIVLCMLEFVTIFIATRLASLTSHNKLIDFNHGILTRTQLSGKNRHK